MMGETARIRTLKSVNGFDGTVKAPHARNRMCVFDIDNAIDVERNVVALQHDAEPLMCTAAVRAALAR